MNIQPNMKIILLVVLCSGGVLAGIRQSRPPISVDADADAATDEDKSVPFLEAVRYPLNAWTALIIDVAQILKNGRLTANFNSSVFSELDAILSFSSVYLKLLADSVDVDVNITENAREEIEAECKQISSNSIVLTKILSTFLPDFDETTSNAEFLVEISRLAKEIRQRINKIGDRLLKYDEASVSLEGAIQNSLIRIQRLDANRSFYCVIGENEFDVSIQLIKLLKSMEKNINNLSDAVQCRADTWKPTFAFIISAMNIANDRDNIVSALALVVKAYHLNGNLPILKNVQRIVDRENTKLADHINKLIEVTNQLIEIFKNSELNGIEDQMNLLGVATQKIHSILFKLCTEIIKILPVPDNQTGEEYKEIYDALNQNIEYNVNIRMSQSTWEMIYQRRIMSGTLAF